PSRRGQRLLPPARAPPAPRRKATPDQPDQGRADFAPAGFHRQSPRSDPPVRSWPSRRRARPAAPHRPVYRWWKPPIAAGPPARAIRRRRIRSAAIPRPPPRGYRPTATSTAPRPHRLRLRRLAAPPQPDARRGRQGPFGRTTRSCPQFSVLEVEVSNKLTRRSNVASSMRTFRGRDTAN